MKIPRTQRDSDFCKRMKEYEAPYDLKVLTKQIVVVRLTRKDGDYFKSKTKKPYDDIIMECMVKASDKLWKESKPDYMYVNEKEINLFYLPNEDGEPTFSSHTGRIQKNVSVYSSIATLAFYKHYGNADDSVVYDFDCRVFSMPTVKETVNNISMRISYRLSNVIDYAYKVMFGDDTFKISTNKKLEKLNSVENILVDEVCVSGILLIKNKVIVDDEYYDYEILKYSGKDVVEMTFEQVTNLLENCNVEKDV